MTTMRFGLSASFPGQPQQPPWDADWTALVTRLAWSGTIYGATTQVPGPSGQTQSGFVDVPAETAGGVFDANTIDASYGSINDYISVNASVVDNGDGPYTEQWISNNSGWNSIKDIEVSNLSAYLTTVTGFVDTWVDASADQQDREVDILQAKRGAVAMGDGNDTVLVGVLANEYTWPSHFNISAGNGNDTVRVISDFYGDLDGVVAPDGGTFNSAPQLSTADITVGNGNDTIILGEISGSVWMGSGTDTIHLTEGDSVAWLGSGIDTVTIDALAVGVGATDSQRGTSDIHVGTGHADITIDDSGSTPRTTLDFIHGHTGGETFATADTLRYGHVDAGSGLFLGGDLSTVAINLAGYSAGSMVTLTPIPSGTAMLLQIHDALTGGVDALALYGTAVAGVSSLNIRFT